MKPSRRVAGVLQAPLAILLVVCVGVPCALLAAYSVFRQDSLLNVHAAIDLGNYRDILTTRRYATYAVNSFAIAVPSALLSVTGGFLIAYYVRFTATRSRSLILAVVVTAFLSSYLALIYAWRTLSGQEGVINSLLEKAGIIDEPLGFLLFSRTAVVIAETNFFLPFTTLVLYASLASVPSNVEAAARDLGARRSVALRRVVLPLCGRGLYGAFVFVLFLTAGDYITPVLIGGIDGSVTFGTLVADQLNTALDYPRGAALALVMFAGLAATAAIVRLGMRQAGLLPRYHV